MSSQLLEIQPRDLRFIFEMQKQSSCAVKLTNKTDNYVAFKVKTTSPKKYCVKPNVGIVPPRATCEFIVAMKAQQIAPPEMVCKDKFLVLSAIVPPETVDITPDMFSKEEGRSVEEKKLRVILVAPPHSPELPPMNGSLQQIPTSDGHTDERRGGGGFVMKLCDVLGSFKKSLAERCPLSACNVTLNYVESMAFRSEGEPFLMRGVDLE